MKTKFLFIGLGGVAILLIGAFAVFTYLQPYSFHGSLINPPVRAADFTLTDHNNKSFRLSDQTGNVVLIFFGYTSCPDVCPTTMADFRQVNRQLGAQAKRVRFIFITVDPERDTPERLRGFVTGFDPAFIGLGGTLTELEPVWKNYGVYRAKEEGGTALGYSMDHSTRIYAIDSRGNLRLTYTYGTDRDEILHDVQYLLDEKTPQAGGVLQ